MPPIEGRPRSMSGPKPRSGSGLFRSLPGRSSTEELSTTPLPVTGKQFDQRDTTILPAQRALVPTALTRQLSNSGATRILPGILADGTEGTEGASPRGTVVIKGEMQKRVSVPVSPRSHKKRR